MTERDNHPDEPLRSEGVTLDQLVSRAMTRGDAGELDRNTVARIIEHGVGAVPDHQREAAISALLRDPDLLDEVLDIRAFLSDEGRTLRLSGSAGSPGRRGLSFARPLLGLAASICLVSGVGLVLELNQPVRSAPPSTTPMSAEIDTTRDTRTPRTFWMLGAVFLGSSAALGVGIMTTRRRRRETIA